MSGVVETNGLAICLAALLAGCELAEPVERRICAGEEPQVSPDGRQIVFQQLHNGSYDVGVRELATGAVRWVSEGPGDAIHPTWAPDGSVIFTFGHETETALAAHRKKVETGWNLYRWKDGRTEQLTKGRFRDYAPSVTADGKTLYFASTRAEAQTGLRSERVQMFRMPLAAGAKPERVWGPDNVCSAAAVSPQLSPDGRLLLWAGADGATDVWHVRVSRVETPELAADLTPPTMYAYGPKWSPSGRRIAFAAVTPDFPDWGVWTADPQKGELVRVADGTNPSWMPDGRSLVYDRDGVIWMMALNGSFPRLVMAADSDRAPSRVVFRVENPALGSVHPLPKEAAFGLDDFYLKVKYRLDKPTKDLQLLVKMQYQKDTVAVVMLEKDARPTFGVRHDDDSYAPLDSAHRIASGRDHVLVGYRHGDAVYLSIDGGAPEKLMFTHRTLDYREPVSLTVGEKCACSVSLVEVGRGRLKEIPAPPGLDELFGREVRK